MVVSSGLVGSGVSKETTIQSNDFEPPEETGTIPYVAKLIREKFPELKNRCVAVADAEIRKDNVPTTPFCMVALDYEKGGHRYQASEAASPEEHFIVEFWFDPVKYTNNDGTETPFWSYYDYHSLRNKMLPVIFDMKPPLGGRVEYVRMDLMAVEHAVVITFRLMHKFEFCMPDDPLEANDGQTFSITTDLIIPISEECCCIVEEEEEDPCP